MAVGSGLACAVFAGIATGGLNDPTATSSPPASALAQEAASWATSRSRGAVVQLRRLGPSGLQAFLDVHANALASAQRSETLEIQHVLAALDAVCQQRDCYASRLFWYTDLEEAKAAARASGKPILSLRLLGNLTDEYSCANSRFFRTVLYANEEVSQYLRDHFVLHWQSVRPVPRVTIDFGDGRTLERTLTGNSIHYVLDAQARPIDALPGLYGPTAFLRALAQAERTAHMNSKLTSQEREVVLRRYHRERLLAMLQDWETDLAKIGRRPSAQRSMDDEAWGQLAALHHEDARLDESSVRLVSAKNPKLAQDAARDAMALAVTKAVIETPLLRTVRTFEGSIALDTVKNEYVLHRAIHEWLAGDAATMNLDALNERVYAELFLTPSSDPWLGLVPAETYSAIENEGIHIAKTHGGTTAGGATDE